MRTKSWILNYWKMPRQPCSTIFFRQKMKYWNSSNYFNFARPHSLIYFLMEFCNWAIKRWARIGGYRCIFYFFFFSFCQVSKTKFLCIHFLAFSQQRSGCCLGNKKGIFNFPYFISFLRIQLNWVPNNRLVASRELAGKCEALNGQSFVW